MNAAGTAVTATHTIDMGAAAQGSELTAYEELQLLNLTATADGLVAVYVARTASQMKALPMSISITWKLSLNSTRKTSRARP